MFSWLLVMPACLDFFHTFLAFFGVESSSVISAIVYIVTLIIAVYFAEKTMKDFFLLFFIYSLFVINYAVFKNTREFLLDSSMIMVYVFFIPFAVFVPLKVRDWSDFFRNMFPFATVAVIVNLFNVFFMNGNEFLNYMDFSYALLPSIGAIYCYVRNDFQSHYSKSYKVFALIVFFVGTIEILSHGARASMIFLLGMIVFTEMLNKNLSFIKRIFLMIAGMMLCLVVSLFQNEIIRFLITLPIFNQSRILNKLTEAQLLESAGRKYLYSICREHLSNMDFDFLGILGDRTIRELYPYPHNFFYEILISFGWLFGCIFIAFLCYLFVFDFVKRSTKISIFLLFCLFMRFMVSGSYIIELKFWLFLFALLSLFFCKKELKIVIKEQ